MKLRTHYAFSLGLLTLLGTLLTHNFDTSLFFSGIVASVGNSLIDRLGHEIRNVHGMEIIRRTPLTHTIPRSAVWGSLPALGLTILYYYVFGHVSEEMLLLDLVSPLNGLSHMLLDAFTEKGIYIKKNGKWTRFALAHLSYNNPIANRIATALGIIMIFVAMNLHTYHFATVFPKI